MRKSRWFTAAFSAVIFCCMAAQPCFASQAEAHGSPQPVTSLANAVGAPFYAAGRDQHLWMPGKMLSALPECGAPVQPVREPAQTDALNTRLLPWAQRNCPHVKNALSGAYVPFGPKEARGLSSVLLDGAAESLSSAISVVENTEDGGNRQLIYGIIAWVCIAAAIVLVVVVVLGSRHTKGDAKTSGRAYAKRRSHPGRSRLLEDKYYRNTKRRYRF